MESRSILTDIKKKKKKKLTKCFRKVRFLANEGYEDGPWFTAYMEWHSNACLFHLWTEMARRGWTHRTLHRLWPAALSWMLCILRLPSRQLVARSHSSLGGKMDAGDQQVSGLTRQGCVCSILNVKAGLLTFKNNWRDSSTSASMHSVWFSNSFLKGHINSA